MQSHSGPTMSFIVYKEITYKVSMTCCQCICAGRHLNKSGCSQEEMNEGACK